ncbi:hypothetical protein OIE66_10745 [Nonomuraea sp. NBC_01738]|uniref:caspase, EACC1-associated type n=1 Tax=Nonomuraea sp. NBC_01738 TaxID=2976003 RepID=UPI002E0F0138|nr:hypothetical protein OIE66_10745 [Nonomuraea sp. NBC_01738]
MPAKAERSPLLLGSPGVRVLIVGSGEFPAGSRLARVEAVGPTVAGLGRSLVAHAGLDPARLTTLLDPASPRELGDALVRAAGEATEVLVVYFVGHGLVSAGSELHLSTRSTVDLTKGIAAHQALPYSVVREVLAGCSAPLILLALDCCFSGRARGAVRHALDAVFHTAPQGMYVLAAADRNEHAWAKTGERHTTFSGALIDLLADGDPMGPPRFTLDDLYRSLSRALTGRGLPAPRRQAVDRSGDEVLAPNRAYADLPKPVSGQVGQTSPYLGLSSFMAEDARYFFGRDDLVELLVDRVRDRLDEGGLLVVTGPSGAGKSSLLHAGLVPALRGVDVVLLRPGGDPLRALAEKLSPLAGTGAGPLRDRLEADPACLATLLDGRRSLIVVDQFEEVFTACQDERARHLFIQALAATTTLIGLRADFIGHCVEHRELIAPLEQPVIVGPLDPARLRRVIEGPAERAGLTLQDGLVGLLLDDLGPGKAAGTLPLLSHALLATWQRREGRELTLEGYLATGGITGALAQSANAVMAGLDEPLRETARQIFTRLVRLGEGADDTRRRAALADLPRLVGASTTLDAFARARLLTVGESTVEITHEALLRAWPELRSWIDADRAGLIARQRLDEDAQVWAGNQEDPAFLYRGTRLATVSEAIGVTHDPLPPRSRDFLGASLRREEAERTTAARAARRRTRLNVALAVLVVLFAVAGMLAVQQWRTAERRELEATARMLTSRADAIRDDFPHTALRLELTAHNLAPGPETLARLRARALSSSLAGTIGDFAGRIVAAEVSPDGRMLAIAARDRVELWDVRRLDRPRRAGGFSVDVRPDSGLSLLYSPVDQLLAVATGTDLMLWDVADPARPRRTQVVPQRQSVKAMAFSPDGRLLAAGLMATTVTLARITPAGTASEIARWQAIESAVLNPSALAFRPDGKVLGVGARQLSTAAHILGGELASLWEVGDPAKPRLAARISAGKKSYSDGIGDLGFSSDGRTLALGGSGPALWNVEDPRAPRPADTQPTTAATGVGRVWTSPGQPRLLLDGMLFEQSGDGWQRRTDIRVEHDGGIGTASFSPDGSWLATSDGKTVHLWNLAGPPVPKRLAETGDCCPRAIATDADGRTIVTGAKVARWDAETTLRRVAEPQRDTSSWDADSVAAHPTERGIAALAFGSGEPARIWDTRGGRSGLITLPGSEDVDVVTFSPDGRTLAGAGGRGDLVVWNVTDPLRPQVIRTLAVRDMAWISSLSFSPDGRTLAAGGAGVVLRKLPDLTDPLVIDGEVTDTVSFSPDGRTLVQGAYDTLTLWDVTDAGEPSRRATVPGHHRIMAAVFSPDGRLLATGGQKDAVKLWEVTDPARPRPLATLSDHGTNVEAITFTRDGRELVSGGSGPELALWDLGALADATAVPYEKLCAAAGGGLTEQEWAGFVTTMDYQRSC